MDAENDETEPEMEIEEYFLATFGGSIESVQLKACSRGQSIVVRYEIVAGPSWVVLGGQRGALSQTAVADYDDTIVINLPIDIAYKSNTPFGWPQLAFTVYGMSSWGSETVIGYGRTHLPTGHGMRHKKVALFAPRATTPFGNIMSWLTGKTPELIDPTIICDGNDSYLMRTKSYGCVYLKMNLVSKGFKDLGYDNVSNQITSQNFLDRF